MPRFMVVTDARYYPSIDGYVEADSVDEALASVVENESRHFGAAPVYVFPLDGCAAWVPEYDDKRKQPYWEVN